MKKYLIKYSIIFIFMMVSLLLEFSGVWIVEGTFYIHDIRYFLTLVVLFSAILFLIKSDTVRFYTAGIILLILGIVNISFILMYDMTGQYFDFAMFNLSGDAIGIIEFLPLNWGYFVIAGTLISAFYIFGRRINKIVVNNGYLEPLLGMKKKFIGCLFIVISLSLNCLTAYNINNDSTDKYLNMLYDNNVSQYNEYGITSSFIDEVYKGLFYNTQSELSNETIYNYLYYNNTSDYYISETSDYFGVSEGNNVVTVLAESLEWFSFISDLSIYPNGMDISEEETRELFPNLYRLYDNSLVLNNHYAREKTDVSEVYSILGSYTTDSFINYDYPYVTMPQTVGNVLESLEGVTQKNSFHNGTANYYNRDVVHDSFGFNHFYASEELFELYPDSFGDYWLSNVRNLDSEMFDSASDLMFYEDERFYTYALTITQHGMYTERDNLTEYHELLATYGMDIYEEDLEDTDPDSYHLYSYLACALEVDAAIGVMFSDLEEKNILEDTTIVIFGDHNAYYHDLSNYVKDIDDEDAENYMELYRVPCMIYDEKLVSAMNENGDSLYVEKFTSQCDIVPTLFDILGINVFENMYYGNSALIAEESIVYSRSFGVFMTNDLYFTNLNSIIYSNPDKSLTESLLEAEISGLKLVEKIKYTDQIFQYDYFGVQSNYDDFISKLKEINS